MLFRNTRDSNARIHSVRGLVDRVDPPLGVERGAMHYTAVPPKLPSQSGSSDHRHQDALAMLWVVQLALVTITAAFSGAVEIPAEGPCGWAPEAREASQLAQAFHYHPDMPTTTDSLSLSVMGSFPSGGYSFSKRMITDNADTAFFDIDISFAGGIHSDMVVPWVVSGCIPPRSRGNFVVRVTVTGGRRPGSVSVHDYDIGVLDSVGVTEPLSIAWVGTDSLTSISGRAYSGRRMVLAMVAEGTWKASEARMWISHDATALAIEAGSFEPGEGCSGGMYQTGSGSAEVAVDCRSETVEPMRVLGSVDVAVLEAFRGWADIRLDSVQVNGSVRPVASVARLISMATWGSQGMDFDGDGRVDFDDFFVFADAFGSTSSFFDFDGDGSVGNDDFFIFADQFGRTAARR